jgi:predicted transcriptional regulator
MKKDTRLTFRVNSDLKKKVEAIAAHESQSVARICEAFIMSGVDAYKEQGARVLRRMLGELGIRIRE